MRNIMTTRYRICPLCEATCGLEMKLEGDRVTSIRGDKEDVFSNGFICPKGAAFGELAKDPDRLRQPLVRRDGALVPASWEEAFEAIAQRLPAIVAEHGADAVAIYLGNPSVHNISLSVYGQVLIRALRSKNLFTASTVDQIPKQLASGLLFGTFTTVAVPDIDRTDFLLILGANPFVSNGSLWTVPDFPARLRRLKERGGRCVVVDPKRTQTAEAAGEHHFIRPGTDAYFLMAIAHTLFADGLVNPGRLAAHLSGLAETEAVAVPFSPEAVAPICGIPAATTRRLAHDLAKADKAAVYGRIGTCTQEFGTLASWLVDVCNILTGNLDEPGGAMFPLAPAFAANAMGTPGMGRGVRIGRRQSRVRGAGEVQGELPVACLAEEIDTPGDGRVRALISIAGNPVLSTPNGARLGRALESLDFMVSFDVYVNETTRHADVILPGPSPLEEAHYDAVFPIFAHRNAARYSPAILPRQSPGEWENLLRLTAILSGQGADADIDSLDDFVAMTQIQKAVASEQSPIHGRDPDEIMAALEPRRGPERAVDLALRSGPYGDGFGRNPDGLSLAKLEANPHGIDLGALAPRIPEALRTPTGKIELAPPLLLADVERLRSRLTSIPDDNMLLIGRRHLRSNNSWMHNLPMLCGGRPRCTLQIHTDDASRLGLRDGDSARVRSRTGSLEAQVEVTEAIMPGVASLPHGWGHDQPGSKLGVAANEPGVNSNLVADELAIDPLSGNAVLNGIPVTIEPA